MRARHLLTLLVCSIIYSGVTAQNLWSDVQPENTRAYTRSRESHLPARYRMVMLNRSLAAERQQQAPMENLTNRKAVMAASFDIPLPDGSVLKAGIIESPIVSVRTQALLGSDVKTYDVTDAGRKSSLGRLTITSTGITGIIFTDQGTVYISPLGKDNQDVHMVYYVRDLKSAEKTVCGVEAEASNLREYGVTAGDCQLRTYRLAVAATGEYTTWAGSQANALTYITTTVNTLNAIYERDATIRFTLVTNNSIIYTNAATDPYATVAFPTYAPGASPPATATGTLAENFNAINAALGSANYDIGIVFNNDWNGGLALRPSVCSSVKGGAAAGLTFGTGANPTDGPQGPIFEGTVAHEIAHQFNATHTHSVTTGACGGGNISASSAWEPGGGSTIMAYAGSCNPLYYQPNSDLYFHIGSIRQIQTYNTSTGGCPVTTSSGNAAPVISIPAASYTIPVSTPFRLTASATDANANTLTFTWEQLDAGTSAATPSATNATGPNFRSYPPTTDSSRTFPRMSTILAGVSAPYEVLPSVSKTMNFTATVRDNATGAGCTNEVDVDVITNAGAGPFTVTSQNTATNWTANGTNTATITWNVANTNNAPVSCTNVNILFSIDGGITYPYTLVANTANDGTENITIPNLPTSLGRLMVQSVGNVFFNINTATITITSACAAEAVTVTPSTTVSASAGNAALDLSLSPLYGTAPSITGTIQSSDATGDLVVNNLSAGNCLLVGTKTTHDTYRFTPTVSGNYTFIRTAATPFPTMLNLYLNTYDPAYACVNFVTSNGTYNGTTTGISNGFIANLTAGQYYTLVIGTFDDASPAMPYNYTVNVTPPGGGGLLTAPANPGAGFNYTYVIVNNATGNIVAIDPGANLSNAGTFPAGSYTVYGLSYANSISLATLNGYVGGLFSTLQNDALYNPTVMCSNISRNSVPVTIMATLPVQFLPLKANKLGNTALLQWGTASEQNSSHFDVLRSADGINFTEVIGTVQAQGTGNNTTHYSFTDHTPGAGVSYYRIRQVDKDGQSSLSNIASVNMSQSLITTRIYPSPAKSTITLDYVTDKRETIQVQISDSKGAMVITAQVNALPGVNIKTFNVSGLAKGIYAVQVTGGTGSSVSRFIKE
jgi:hypothetical protein